MIIDESIICLLIRYATINHHTVTSLKHERARVTKVNTMYGWSVTALINERVHVTFSA